MTPLAPLRPQSRAAGRARYGAVALSLLIHGAAAAAILLAVADERPVPGGAISVELVAAVPGGSAGAHATADRPAREPEPEKTVEPRKPAETTEAKPTPAPEEKPEPPVAPVADEGREIVKPKPKPEPERETVRALEETARPKLAHKPATAMAAHKAEPDRARDTGAAGPAGSAANGPQVATVERTAPGFAVGSGANPLPDYPYRARRAGYEGRVVLEVAVGADGAPRTVAVARSSGHDSLDDAALAAVRRWRFTPATAAGLPVAATIEVPITFRLVAGDR